jgi:hypothetical protein
MTDIVIQASFNAGEWSPNLFARVDVNKYRSAAALLSNFYVDHRGGASTRSGFAFVCPAKGSQVRLIAFQAAFNTGYCLELGDYYMRPIYKGSPVLESALPVTAASRANPCVINVAGSSYSVGDWVYISGVGGMTQLNNIYYKVSAVAGTNVTLADMFGNPVDSTSFSAFTSNGSAARIITISTPWAASDLELLKFAQVTNTMILCHPAYPPYKLVYTSATSWSLAPLVLGTSASAPTVVAITTTLAHDASASSITSYSYVVTTIDANGQESQPSSAVQLINYYDYATVNASNVIAWNPVSGAKGYNVYRAPLTCAGVFPSGLYYGFSGTCTGTTFVDTNITPDFTEGPPVVGNPISGGAGTYPSVPSFFQQRLVLAGSANKPQTFDISRAGKYYNFDTSNPTGAGDAINVTLATNVQQNIKSIVSSNAGMLVLTDAASWLVNGGSSGSAVSPSAIVATLQSSIGACDVPPLQINYDILYVQSKGCAVRDLAYNIYYNIFTGADISLNASHLFFGYTIKEWAWSEAPFHVVYAVRNDGIMLTLTFVKDQEFIGWAHSFTQGSFTSVCAVQETTTDLGTVDAVYTAVQRVVNGHTLIYIERKVDRYFPNGLSSAYCVDAGIQYTGAPALTFSSAVHLAGLVVTGLATDNLGNVTVIPAFTMPISGIFTLPTPTNGATGYTVVTVGIGYLCQLQTMPLDVGQTPIQGKLKRIPQVDVRVKDTLGLTIGQDFTNQIPMKDLIPGNVSSMATGLSAQIVNGLYTGDARTLLTSSYNIYGQFAIQQAYPYPATVLGVFPTLVIGDD